MYGILEMKTFLNIVKLNMQNILIEMVHRREDLAWGPAQRMCRGTTGKESFWKEDDRLNLRVILGTYWGLKSILGRR